MIQGLLSPNSNQQPPFLPLHSVFKIICGEGPIPQANMNLNFCKLQ